MKNLRVFNRMKYLAAGCFLTTSLVGHAFYPPIHVSTTQSTKPTVETDIEDSKFIKGFSEQAVEVQMPEFLESGEFMNERIQSILLAKKEEVSKDGVEAQVLESEEEKEKRILNELRKEAEPYASVYVSVKQNSLSFVVNGTIKGQINSDKFYQVFNEILVNHPEIEYCYFFLKNYQNQVDFTRLGFSDDVEISISLDNSREVKLDGILDNIMDTLVNNSSVEDLEELAKSINRNGGFIGLENENQSLNSTIEAFIGDSDVTFNRIHLTWNNTESTLYLPALTRIKADTVAIDYSGSSFAHGELQFNENIDTVILYDIPINARIFVDDHTKITLNYMETLKEDILNCPTIRSLQNVDVGLYFAYGPDATEDKNIRIKITDKKCILQTECEDWQLSSEKTEEGLWILSVTYSNQINEKNKVKVLG